MRREIILVEIVQKSDLSTDRCRAFTDSIHAEDYFRWLIDAYDITDDEQEISAYVDQGFCDFTYLDDEMSLITKTIIFEED